MTPVDEQSARDDDPKLEVIEEGGGETVILVHGGASSNRQSKTLIEALKADFRVLAPNLYGAGASCAAASSKR